MLKSITIGQYIYRDSIIHRLDPRIKILITLIVMIGLFMVSSFIGFGLVAIFISIIIFLSKLPYKRVLLGLKPILFIAAFTFVLHLFFTTGGDVILKVGFITVYEEGFYTGIFMVVRILLLILFTSLLTLTTSPIELTDAIEHLLKPFQRLGVPAHELAMMMTIALRFIPTLMDEAEKIMKAQQARGADFESGGLIKKAKSLIPLLIPLFVSAFRRADDLALAMEARCYRGGENRTRMNQLQYRVRDFIAFGLAVVFTVIISIL
ncbi:transporter [Anoxybacter fermentans]|uniref:Energy-coupling factor transporter transmembrane protein EcfT n=1 Tax=Anoxybacter fermentans TaxID=1323375 RepID=A0A3Q9HT90_9FIRM|nr:energy-coupling factor transporter transmembrane protein EcfT [Anoxybacter fermentans]AZR74749.1 transporter [Anoxybacter fermentans]